MKRVLLTLAGILIATGLWASALIYAVAQGWMKQSPAPADDWRTFSKASIAAINGSSAGNAGFVLMEDGDVVAEYFHSANAPMNGDTLFQMASVSKWITAWGVMTLVEQGRIDLDTPVVGYLSRWTLPDTEYDNNQVTVRRLLSHTAGLTDGLGYGGFATAEELQSLEASLTEAADSVNPGGGATRVGAPADGYWRYSGGGYTLLQLLIEETTGQAFNDYLRDAVLLPLGMSRSTYVVDRALENNLAEFYDTDGSLATHYHFTAVAAASLYSSTNDLLRFLQAHCQGPGGEPPGRGVLSDATLRAMRTPAAQWLLVDVWGLGMAVHPNAASDDYLIGHDGGNLPAISTTARVDPGSCDGLVVLSSGSPGLAPRIGSDWVYWRTQRVGGLDFIRSVLGLARTFLTGAGVILVAGVVIGWVTRRRPA